MGSEMDFGQKSPESTNALGAIADGADSHQSLAVAGIDGRSGRSKEESESLDPEVIDPLAGMPAVDRWGIKGLRTLMNNYPDYHAMVVGMDPTSLGLDMTSQE